MSVALCYKCHEPFMGKVFVISLFEIASISNRRMFSSQFFLASNVRQNWRVPSELVVAKSLKHITTWIFKLAPGWMKRAPHISHARTHPLKLCFFSPWCVYFSSTLLHGVFSTLLRGDFYFHYSSPWCFYFFVTLPGGVFVTSYYWSIAE